MAKASPGRQGEKGGGRGERGEVRRGHTNSSRERGLEEEVVGVVVEEKVVEEAEGEEGWMGREQLSQRVTRVRPGGGCRVAAIPRPEE